MIHDDDWESKIIDSKLPSIVKLGATWCPTCITMLPTHNEIEELYVGRINFAEMDVDECPQTVKNLKLGGLPALVFVHKKRVKRTLHGIQSVSKIKSAIEEVFKLEQ